MENRMIRCLKTTWFFPIVLRFFLWHVFSGRTAKHLLFLSRQIIRCLFTFLTFVFSLTCTCIFTGNGNDQLTNYNLSLIDCPSLSAIAWDSVGAYRSFSWSVRRFVRRSVTHSLNFWKMEFRDRIWTKSVKQYTICNSVTSTRVDSQNASDVWYLNDLF